MNSRVDTKPTKPAPRLERTSDFDLGSLEWKLSGFWPTSWTGKSMELGFALEPDVAPVPVTVPGSVQEALFKAGVLPNWFHGLNYRLCEWVEHREWMFSTRLPDAWFQKGRHFVLNCAGLDGPGLIVFNKQRVGEFTNSFIPYQYDLTKHVRAEGNELHLIFLLPPQWLGQVGYTSQMKEWKPRFNYCWDWIPRQVQIGPWEPVTLRVTDGAEISSLRCRTDWDVADKTGKLWVHGQVEAPETAHVRVTLRDGEKVLRSTTLKPAEFVSDTEWSDLSVAPWWPNGEGDRPLYTLDCELVDANGNVLDQKTRRVGFKNVVWEACANGPKDADPWICVVNGRPVFLQGIDWAPLRATFADLKHEDYEKMVGLYAELGCNIFRVWGGAILEKEWFYDLCDELGLLVWQEFSLCSAGHENWPHEDEPSIEILMTIAESYIVRRQHHASLLMWCGGNELQGQIDGAKTGIGKPVGLDHPLMKRWNALVEREDPGRRFMPTSASGPRFLADEKDIGKGLHWDVHGPWKVPGANPKEWAEYWKRDDALFRSEVGAASASSAEIIRHYAGGLPVTPGTLDNPLWRRFPWWIEWSDFTKEKGHEPASLEEYVEWSQARQAVGIATAIRGTKARFPGIGGIILWMGHDVFPCTANTAIIDFHGKPKPAAIAASEVWKTPVEKLRL